MANKEVVVTNKQFAKQSLPDICESHNINPEWANNRQASKYRNKKGRVYLTIKNGEDKGFGT